MRNGELHDIVHCCRDKIKEDMVGGECGPRLRGDDNYIQGLWVQGRDRLEEGVGGRIILKRIRLIWLRVGTSGWLL